MSITRDLAIATLEVIFSKPENIGKNELSFPVFGLTDERVLFEIAKYYRDSWENIEVCPPHNEGVAFLHFRKRRTQ